MNDPVCDIIIPVHNSLEAADDCLRSVLAYTPLPVAVTVVDDASDPYVAEWLQAIARSDPRVRILRNEQNQGFLRSVNRGISASTAPFVCLLNSDTIVTSGWLEGMLRCAESDPRIAVVNPVSNAATNLSVLMGPGLDVFTMAKAIARVSKRRYPDVVTAVGFCFLITRSAIDRFGGFDEVYGHGYCEESDYCMRVTGAGLRTVVADDVFVYHRGGATFGRSRERYLKNRATFDARWSARYEVEYPAFLRRDPLRYLRTAVNEYLEDPALVTRPGEQPQGQVAHGGSPRQHLHPHGPLATLWVMTCDAWRRGGARGLAAKIPVASLRLREALRRLRGRAALPGPIEVATEQLSAAPVDPEVRVRLFGTPEYSRNLPRARGLRVGVLVWGFDVCGGVLTLVELINGLVLDGHSVVIATLADEPPPGVFTLYASPLVFRSPDTLAAGLAEADLDVVIATFWPTATEWVPAIRRRSPALRIAYFLQDYEAWFLREDDVAGRQRIIDSYCAVDVRIVTSRWLQAKVAEHGHESTVIPIGIDPRVFYPRQPRLPAARPPARPWRVLVQARPQDPWRGFANARKIFEVLARRRADIEAVFFGCTDAALADCHLPFRYQNEGIVADRNSVARLYSSCDILFDPSQFQAFGLPGIEAMACATPTVLPARGGILQYAEHEVNSLLVEPGDVEGSAAAIERLIDDEALRSRLVTGGLATAQRFTVQEMVRRHLLVYEALAVH
jgi:O-antigen biosynthesis protein